jgi:hypothetical protein
MEKVMVLTQEQFEKFESAEEQEEVVKELLGLPESEQIVIQKTNGLLQKT